MRFLLRGFGFLSEVPADGRPESCPSAPCSVSMSGVGLSGKFLRCGERLASTHVTHEFFKTLAFMSLDRGFRVHRISTRQDARCAGGFEVLLRGYRLKAQVATLKQNHKIFEVTASRLLERFKPARAVAVEEVSEL
jgi:hypothetical protein